ncbi:MAG: PA domain-containing protein, partial [Saprospiraceae bacterium]
MKKLRILTLLLSTLFLNTVHAQYVLQVSDPASIAGKYPVSRAAFSAALTDTVKGALKLADNGNGSTIACDTIIGVSGKIAVIDRGTCAFIDKALLAQRNGAIAVIICNNAAGAAFPFGPKDYTSLKIPVVMLSQSDCIKVKIGIGTANGSIYFNNSTTPATVLWKEDFKNRLTGWTTKARLLPIDTFGWDARGMTDGIARGEIQSPTAGNGAAIFDADFKTSKGDIANVPATGPYQRHYGELTSPTINCSTFSNLRLRFFQHFAPLNSGYSNGAQSSFIAFSYDGGVTFPDSTELNPDVQPNDETEPGSFLTIDVPKFDGKSQCKFKFIFNGDFYDWIIDDIELISRGAVDLLVTENFFFPFNYATPASQITTDTSTFYAEVTNLGTQAVGNAKMRVQIKDPTGKIIHNDSLIIANIPGNNADSLLMNFPKTFVPGKLAVGEYTLIYSIEAPANAAADGNLKDNKIEKTFAVTNDLYSKHDLNQNSRGLPIQTNYQWANLYLTSTDWNSKDKFKAMDVGFGAFINAPDKLVGKSVTLYLARFTDKVSADYSNWDVSKSLTNNPDQVVIDGIAVYDFKTEGSERATVTLQDFNTFVDGVDLKKGSRYLVAASYADAANKIIHFLELDYFYDFGSFLYESGQWQLFGFAPELSLRLSLSTPTDEVALPDYSLQLSPNPASDFIKANVNFEKANNVNFVIADIQG